MYSLGIDIGYTTVKTVILDNRRNVIMSSYKFHKGQLKKTLCLILDEIALEISSHKIMYCSITGSGSDYILERFPLKRINDITALIEGAKVIYPKVNSIVAIGGQSAAYITNVDSSSGEMLFELNTGCSAGTGSFLEEQVNRLNLEIASYSEIASKATDIPRIAGRCSVFAKTDIIHHQQDGVTVDNILLGLAKAVAINYKSMIVQNNPVKAPVIFVGGVSLNDVMFGQLQQALKISSEELIKVDNREVCAAVGTAKLAFDEENTLSLKMLREALVDEMPKTYKLPLSAPVNAPLYKYGNGDSLDKHTVYPLEHKNEGYLGIDIGSTSTNLVLLNDDNKVLSYLYLRTKGAPIAAVSEGLKSLISEFGDQFTIKGVCTTGSGRALIGKRLRAELIKDEITAQSKATMTLAPEFDTVFEIGGQDSKYIRIEKYRVNDFQMNKVCAAGTGAFIEEQAKKLSMSLSAFSDSSIRSTLPLDLGERCTVFIEASIMEQLTKGAKKEDIAAGLCYSIVKNYLNKVVGQKKIGEKIALQGGIAYNQGVVNAFRAITGKELEVLPYFSVTGAYGAAVLANKENSRRSLGELMTELNETLEVVKEDKKQEASSKLEELFLDNYTGLIESEKKTVGIPRVMFLHKLFPVFNTFFRELGYNTILTDQTDENLIELSGQYALSDACYPIKLVHGHVAKLIELEVDYIFLPSLETMKHDISKTRCNYGCVYMQNLSRLVESNVGIKEAGIKLLAPTLSFQMGKKHMMQSMIKLGKELGKNPAQTLLAMKKGMGKLSQYIKATEKEGMELVNSLKPDECAFVIVTRAYGIKDPVLNMEVPKILKKLGHKVLTLSHLPAHDIDISLEHENMFWPFGQHMISGAQIIKEHPNLYAIYLTNHGCGPDTIIHKYFDEAMGDKPYLHLEVDEHASAVGVKTRIEAFINSIDSSSVNQVENDKEKIKNLSSYVDKVSHTPVAIEYNWEGIEKDKTLLIPNLYPYTQIVENILTKKDIPSCVLPVTTESSLEVGLAYTITKEAHSLTGLMGDVLTFLNQYKDTTPLKLFVPTNEGAEVQGQYNRVLRSLLDTEGYSDVDIVAPFIEDILYDTDMAMTLIWATVLGDLILLANESMRDELLKKSHQFYDDKGAQWHFLEELAVEISSHWKQRTYDKELMVIGERLMLHNTHLHHSILQRLEEDGHRVVRSPLSEQLLHMWRLHVKRGHQPNRSQGRKNLNQMDAFISKIHRSLGRFSPFSDALDLSEKHYNLAKLACQSSQWDGIIHMSSMYENTHTIVKMIRSSNTKYQSVPVLDIGMEKLLSEQNKLALDSFVYFLKKR